MARILLIAFALVLLVQLRRGTLGPWLRAKFFNQVPDA